MPGWNAILFDLDDTLFPEREFVESGLDAVAAYLERDLNMAASEIRQELLAIDALRPRQPVMDCWVTRHGLKDPAIRQRMIDVYRHHHPRIQLRPGMRALLDTLRQTRRLGLISDGWMATQQNKLSALGVAPLFQAIVFSDQWGREYWKPHERPFLAALDQLKATAIEAVYIGDNPLKDFAACRAIGMASIRLRLADGLYAHEEPPSPNYQADWTVSSVAELGRLLTGSPAQGEGFGRMPRPDVVE